MRRWYPLVAVYLSIAAAVAVCFWYTSASVRRSERISDASVRESEQTWCDLVSTLDDQYKKTPPPTENGKVFAQQIHVIRVRYRCP